MCTVSWIHQPDGYHLLCNRDEKRTRGRAFAPALFRRGGVRYIAPIDADFGGTWITVNEYGLSLCLLNGTYAGQPAQPRRSRGYLLKEIAWETSARESMLAMRQLDLSLYAPFSAVALEPGHPAMIAEWNGESLSLDPSGDSHMPLTSSSYDPTGVRNFRLNDFARRVGPDGAVDLNLLHAFHASHGDGPDAYSPCMHRYDAETVSFSWISVSRDGISFRYSPGSPCQCSPKAEQTLARAA